MGLATALLACVGCEKKSAEYYLPTAAPVEWGALALGDPVAAEDDYRLIVEEPTQGVFPAALAVARVAALPVDEQTALVLDMTPEVDFLDWNSLFDDFRSVSEAFPLNEMALDGADVSAASLLDAAEALDAGMLLIYTEVRLSLHRALLRGVLYDVDARRMLASVQSSAYVPDPILPDEDCDRDLSSAEQQRRDARLLALARFEQNMRDCMLALMANDEPVSPVAPEGWIPDRPIEPIMWPPVGDLAEPYDPRRYND